MPTILTTQALPNNTYIITAAFTDDDGAPVTPNAGATWSMTDNSGNISNYQWHKFQLKKIAEIYGTTINDNITGNSDRHNGNYLITDDGKMVAIDNGMVGGIHTPHHTQASLALNTSSFGYLSFPYGLSDEIDKRSKGGEKPTKEELILLPLSKETV